MDPNLFTSWHSLFIMAIPVLIAYVCKPTWPIWGKFAVTMVACFIASFIELAMAGTCTLSNLPNTFWQVAALVFTGYSGILKPLDKWGVLDWLENKGNV